MGSSLSGVICKACPPRTVASSATPNGALVDAVLNGEQVSRSAALPFGDQHCFSAIKKSECPSGKSVLRDRMSSDLNTL